MKDSTSPYFRLAKIADIAYINVIWFAIGYTLGNALDYVFNKLYGTDYNKTKTWVLIAEAVSQVIVVGILIYFGRNLGQFIPSPFNGVAGLDHYRVKELLNGAMLGVYITFFHYSLQDKLAVVKNRRDKNIQNVLKVG